MQELKTLTLELLNGQSVRDKARFASYFSAIKDCENPSELRDLADLELYIESLETYNSILREADNLGVALNERYGSALALPELRLSPEHIGLSDEIDPLASGTLPFDADVNEFDPLA